MVRFGLILLAILLAAPVEARDTIVLSGGKLYWLTKAADGSPRHVLIVPDVNLDVDVPPPVVVIPPPDDPPVVVPPVVTPGARVAYIIRETADSTPELNRLIVALRSGPQFDYLKSKGHKTYVWDKDAKDASGGVPWVIRENAAAITELGLPCVLIYDPTLNKLVAKAKLPATATGVVDLVKANGG